jgi:hypothetical protein
MNALFGTAVTATAVVPAAAALSFPLGVDPIFAAIKKERAAFAEYQRTNKIKHRIEEEKPDDVMFHDGGAHLDIEAHGLELPPELSCLVRDQVWSANGRVFVCWSKDHVDRAFRLIRARDKINKKSRGWKAFAAEWKKAHADFDEMIAARDRGRVWREATLYDRVCEADDSALNAWSDAEEMVCETPPTTPQGLLALLDFLDKQRDTDKGADDYLTSLAFPNIATTIRGLLERIAA